MEDLARRRTGARDGAREESIVAVIAGMDSTTAALWEGTGDEDGMRCGEQLRAERKPRVSIGGRRPAFVGVECYWNNGR